MILRMCIAQSAMTSLECNLKCVGAGKSYFDINGSLDHIVGFGATTMDAFEYSVGIAKSCVNNVSGMGDIKLFNIN